MKKIGYLILAVALIMGLVLSFAGTIFAGTIEHIKASSLTAQQDSYTDIIQWHIIITGIKDGVTAPAQITVYWGSYSETVDLGGINGHEANYYVDVPTNPAYVPGSHVTDATAEDTGWVAENGQFTMSTPSRLTPPVPELPAAALLGFGLVGIVTFIVIKRRQATARG